MKKYGKSFENEKGRSSRIALLSPVLDGLCLVGTIGLEPTTPTMSRCRPAKRKHMIYKGNRPFFKDSKTSSRPRKINNLQLYFPTVTAQAKRPGRRPGYPQIILDTDDPQGQGALPQPVPDPAHLRIHDAVSRRASDVGGKTDGHSSWVMIARVYGRYIPNDGDTSGSKAAALFGTPVQIPMEDSM